MKETTILLFVVLLSGTVLPQTNPPATTVSSNDYYRKSDHQKTAAWVFLGGGAALVIAGGIISSNGVVDEIWTGHSSSYNTGGVIMGIGLASMAASVPFFIASSKNRKRAMNAKIAVHLEQVPEVAHLTISRHYIPVAGLVFSLR